MSVYKGNLLIAGGGQTMPLLSFLWADHQLNNISWLRADTFSWQDGSVYTAVYNHLVADISGKTAQSETIGSTTISFYLADDGHKITTDESAVASIYSETGVAWYYVLDTTNTRFKLPRTQFGFTGYRDEVGGFVDAGLPNITGSVGGAAWRMSGAKTGAFSSSVTSTSAATGGSATGMNVLNFDASDSNSIYGNSTTVQPKATQMYLYFYVGQFTQSAIAQTAGLNASLFNAKVDIGHQVIDFQAPTASNNYTWYRKYADGWVEQGGYVSGASSYSIVYPITFQDVCYHILTSTVGQRTSSTGDHNWLVITKDMSATGFTLYIADADSATWVVGQACWRAEGMYAQ